MASLESYEKLKRLYGIRNRFWARSVDTLTPLLRDAHNRALLQNHKALLIAMRATERSLRAGEALPQRVFYRSFTRAFQYLRRVGPLALRPGQQAALLSKNDHVSLTVRNSDGSLDARLRQRLLSSLERVAAGIPEISPESMLDAPPGEWAVSTLLAALPLEEPVAEKEGELWDEILDSPTGQLLGNYIPGFSILLKLYRERERLKEGEWIAVAGEILGEGARSTAQGAMQFLLSQMRSGAKLAGPLSFLFGVSVDRAMLLKKQCDSVDGARRRIEELLPLYRQYR